MKRVTNAAVKFTVLLKNITTGEITSDTITIMKNRIPEKSYDERIMDSFSRHGFEVLDIGKPEDTNLEWFEV